MIPIFGGKKPAENLTQEERCKRGDHNIGRWKQWVVNGNAQMGAYCRACGTFVPMTKEQVNS